MKMVTESAITTSLVNVMEMEKDSSMKMVTESAITTSLVNVMAAEMEKDSSMKMVTESVTIASLDTAGDIIMETRAVDSPEAGNTRLFFKKRRILCEKNTGYISGLGSSSHY